MLRSLRLLSAYRLRSGEILWVITEANRSVTTLLLPQDYSQRESIMDTVSLFHFPIRYHQAGYSLGSTHDLPTRLAEYEQGRGA